MFIDGKQNVVTTFRMNSVQKLRPKQRAILRVILQ